MGDILKMIRMWSRGLGRENMGISLGETKVMTLSEAIDYMAKPAREPLLNNVETTKVIALSGKMVPTGWDFVITMGKKDFFQITCKLFTFKLFRLFFRDRRGLS